jgi:hypothetical protein
MNKQPVDGIEPRPAVLEFQNGHFAGTIYAHRVGGRIVEAYRGYSYGYAPLAPAIRNGLTSPTNR